MGGSAERDLRGISLSQRPAHGYDDREPQAVGQREGAESVEREIRAMQSLATRTRDLNDRWTPPIVKTVASEGVGTEALAEAIADYEAYLKKENLVFKKNVENWQERLVEMLRDAMLEKARGQIGDGSLERYAAEIAEHKRDPYSLVEEIVRGVNPT